MERFGRLLQLDKAEALFEHRGDGPHVVFIGVEQTEGALGHLPGAIGAFLEEREGAAAPEIGLGRADALALRVNIHRAL